MILGLKTEEKCDKWPVNKCSIEKATVRKYTPETKCEKIPRKLCAPDKCGYRQVQTMNNLLEYFGNKLNYFFRVL